VHKHITTLEKKGFIAAAQSEPLYRIIQLPKSVKDQVSDSQVAGTSSCGRIAAGRPLEAVGAKKRETIRWAILARREFLCLQVKVLL